MLSRVINSNNENSSYPLVDINTVYPDNLITDCSICVDTPYRVYLESVVVMDNYVTVTISMDSDTTQGRVNVYGSAVKESGLCILPLKMSTDDSAIGWIWLGSGIHHSGSYAQKIRICDSCIHVNSVGDYPRLRVNGKDHPLYGTLNIILSGDLGSVDVSDAGPDKNSEGYQVTLSNINNPRYDSEDVESKGGIVSVNGIPPEDGILTISLPKYTDPVTGEVIDVFKVEHIDSGNDPVDILMIETIPDSIEYTKQFTCPDSDILLDKITTGRTNIAGSEAPLDEFIEWYKNKYSKNPDTGTEV